MPKHQLKTSAIYCGDNLEMLKEVPDESVDLIYIDPPFNSNRNYEVFWGDSGEKRAFDDRFGDADAYIRYMRPRVVEMYRVLKKTGSFYYHCDWHASHYVKVMLDQIFNFNNLINEIIWCYETGGRSNNFYPRKHDTIFWYAKDSKNYVFNDSDVRLVRDTSTMHEPILTDEHGKKYQRNIKLGKEYRYYIDKGVLPNDWWSDIQALNPAAKERLGYPTQKPVALLERIVKSSSKKDDVVLDAFCGCGTALVAAQKLGRKWIGIDISPTACRVMAQRLWDTFKLTEGKDFQLVNMMRNEAQLREIPPFEFENWAVIALGGIPNRAKVGDFGIDGKLYPIGHEKVKSNEKGLFGDIDTYYPIQVKQKDKAGRPDMDAFETAMRRDKRHKGYFISFDFTEDAMKEIRRLDKEGELEIIPVTVKELLDKSGFEISQSS
ncbi:MAG: DNA methyltransferase [bacterium]